MRYYPNRNQLWQDEFFDDFFSSDKNKAMACDIRETETGYELAMNLPGFDKQEISMSLENGYLNITASHQQSQENKSGQYIRQERYLGSYQRTFYIGKNLQEEDIHASYKNGVLEIFVPKVSQRVVETKKIIPIE